MKNLFLIIIALVITGCSATSNLGAPQQSYNENGEITALSKYYSLDSVVDVPLTISARNNFIVGRLALINLQYIKFVRELSAVRSEINTAFDILGAGLGLTTALVGSYGAAAALGAASAGVGATRTSIDKNFFYEKTVGALVGAMNAQRKVALIPVLAGLKQDVDTYPLGQALSDLSEYYFAGTFAGGLQAIEKDSGAKEKLADEAIEVTRSESAQRSIASSPVQVSVSELLNKIDKLQDNLALNLAKNPPVNDLALTSLLMLRDPNKKYLSDPSAARLALKFRVAMMRNPERELVEWKIAIGD